MFFVCLQLFFSLSVVIIQCNPPNRRKFTQRKEHADKRNAFILAFWPLRRLRPLALDENHVQRHLGSIPQHNGQFIGPICAWAGHSVPPYSLGLHHFYLRSCRKSQIDSLSRRSLNALCIDRTHWPIRGSYSYIDQFWMPAENLLPSNISKASQYRPVARLFQGRKK